MMACSKTVAPFQPAGRQLELAYIFEHFADELPALSADQSNAVYDILNCRTEAFGGHVYRCDHCNHQIDLYNSCLNRHCPKCQGLNQTRWLEARQKDLLPVEYFHVVFTISTALHAFFRINPKRCYNLLFSAVAETLKEVALNPDRLGAQIGFIAILHTWTQTLLFHPHLHCIVPGGGLSPDGARWISCKPRFFLPVSILSTVFRAKLLSKLEKAVNDNELQVENQNPRKLLKKATRCSWVVYAKAPFAGPDQVLRYLGQYTHRIAISNHRLVSMEGRQVTFRYKDRADDNKQKTLTLDAVDFLCRFLNHIMPKGFMRIRHFGLLANSVRKKAIARCREYLDANHPRDGDTLQDPEKQTWQQLLERVTGIDATLCPICKTGHLIPKKSIPRGPPKWVHAGRAESS